jgi:hypothetical protein
MHDETSGILIGKLDFQNGNRARMAGAFSQPRFQEDGHDAIPAQYCATHAAFVARGHRFG